MDEHSSQNGKVVATIVGLAVIITNIIGLVILTRLCKKRCRSKMPDAEPYYTVPNEMSEAESESHSAWLDDDGYQIPVEPPPDYNIPAIKLAQSPESMKNKKALFEAVTQCTVEMSPKKNIFNYNNECAENNTNNITEQTMRLTPKVKLTLTVSP